MMFSQILVPLDGSLIAEQVLPFAHALANGLSIPIKLLSVIDTTGILPSADGTRGFDSLIDKVARESEAYLERTAQSLAGPAVDYAVEQGHAAETIAETAARNATTLIAMATHGRSGIRRWWLGSVAEKVLRGSNNPLLLVKASESGLGGELPLRSVLVPLDGSDLAETVLSSAAHITRAMNIELLLARASEIPATAYYRSEDFPEGGKAFIPSYEEVLRAATQEARDYLEKKIEEMQREGVNQVRPVVLNGSAAEEIIDLAQRTQGSLIAMCTHGRSGVTRWTLGSVTEKVVHHSGSPVLIMHPAV